MASVHANKRLALGKDEMQFLVALILIPVLFPGCTPKAPVTPPPIVAPAVPLLSSPDNGSTVYSLSPKLEWSPSANATAYGLQVASVPNFTKLSGLQETRKRHENRGNEDGHGACALNNRNTAGKTSHLFTLTGRRLASFNTPP